MNNIINENKEVKRIRTPFLVRYNQEVKKGMIESFIAGTDSFFALKQNGDLIIEEKDYSSEYHNPKSNGILNAVPLFAIGKEWLTLDEIKKRIGDKEND